MTLAQTDELAALVQNILATQEFQLAPQRSALFGYLWEKREERSRAVDIWDEVLQRGSKSRQRNTTDYYFDDTVRQSCYDLRKALRAYFARVTSDWHIDLPPAIPNSGFQLKITLLKSPAASIGRAFWQPHLDRQTPITVVYVEQLFFQDWKDGHVFRYYDLNSEHPEQALAELKQRHRKAFNSNLHVSYPYVACGEIEARDLITCWFSEHALIKVGTAVTRRMEDRTIWDSSLILLGSSPSNHLITDVLDSGPHRGFELEERSAANGRDCSRVVVKNPSDAEKQRLRDYLAEGGATDSDWTLEFNPARGKVLAILARVPNPHSDTVVTIINSDFGRAVEQIARLVTDDDRLNRLAKLIDWKSPLPTHFEILFSIPIPALSKDHRPAKIEPLAWRSL